MPATTSIITLLTDFGDRDAYVGIMKGVIVSLAPDARLVDLTHHVGAQDIHEAAYILETALPWFPPGTIHVAVVDPGVGSDRAALAVRAGASICLAPDNGLLTPLLESTDDIEVVRIERVPGRDAPISATFHGRDVFSPAAAHLARGRALSDLGPTPDGCIVLDDYRASSAEGVVRGRVLHIDRFGNAITSIRRVDVVDVEDPRVVAAGHVLGGIARTYADVEADRPLALFGSADHLEIAVSRGNAAETLGLAAGDEVLVRRPGSTP